MSETDEDVLQIFFKERELNGDFISRASDLLWQRKFRISGDSTGIELADVSQQTEQVQHTPSTLFPATQKSMYFCFQR